MKNLIKLAMISGAFLTSGLQAGSPVAVGNFFEATMLNTACHFVNESAEVSGSHDETSQIWTNCSNAALNASVELTSYNSISAPGVSGAAVGDYSGYVFVEKAGVKYRLTVNKMQWTGEDIYVSSIEVTAL